MKVKEITSVIEEFAPLSYQESYDNAGLIVGSPEQEVAKALLCVDITEEVIDEAETIGADMVIAHHPIIFHPLKRFNGSTYIERVVACAIRRSTALYACHTNLDSTAGGMRCRSRCSNRPARNIRMSDSASSAPSPAPKPQSDSSAA